MGQTNIEFLPTGNGKEALGYQLVWGETLGVGCHGSLINNFHVNGPEHMSQTMYINPEGKTRAPIDMYGMLSKETMEAFAKFTQENIPTIRNLLYRAAVTLLDYRDLVLFSGPTNYGKWGKSKKFSAANHSGTLLCNEMHVADFGQWLIENGVGTVVATPVLTNRNHMSPTDTSLIRGFMWLPPTSSARATGAALTRNTRKLPKFDSWRQVLKAKHGLEVPDSVRELVETPPRKKA